MLTAIAEMSLIPHDERESLRIRAHEYLCTHSSFGVEPIEMMLRQMEEHERRLGDCMSPEGRIAVHRNVNAAAITLDTLIQKYSPI